ncbi:unnamed protein product [Adineta steineri]|uniref:Uncharacterized protein n=1 Tax=Adineta steineri TaxID=433720 RepID=A0A813PP60_9BILA|nr:unnamed protein product [Adineta steineri]CAF3525721.1 unnamed protein product [Adineta steineri]
MSTTITYYCSCSACTKIRNKQPKHYRSLNLFRYLLICTCCSSRSKLILDNQSNFSSINDTKTSTITFRDIDITHKHCSKHDVLVKASRPHISRIKHEELRQRVKDANQRWTRMSILPANLIDFIFINKDSIPFCTICYENLSPLTFDLCHKCITTAINYKNTLSTMSTITVFTNSIENVSDEIESYSIDYIEGESISP